MQMRTVMVVILLCGGGGGGGEGGGGGVEALQYDSQYSTILRGPEKSEFGFSVALWKTGRKKVVVVGAPRSTASHLGGGSTPLGAIHLCDGKLSTCPALPDLPYVVSKDERILKFTGPQVLRNGTMGFGETVYASSILLACAPRYPVLDSLTHSLQGRGACYILNSPGGKAVKIFPFTEQTFYHNYTEDNVRKYTAANNSIDFTAFASFGFSGNTDLKGRRLFIGAPNAFRSQGVVLYSSKSARTVKKQKTDLNTDTTTDGYLEGWSAATGKYGEDEYLAVSRPGYGNKSGQIIFYDTRLASTFSGGYSRLEGSRIAGWFGYSLASCKVDGDTYSDLLVGAPLDSRDPPVYPDAGVVYLYYAPLLAEAPRESPLKLFGEVSWGRFGTSVACVGDLNGDKYGDVAIGAPGAGGRVYIYRGGSTGLHPEPTQVIHASTFFPTTTTTTFGFGFSLSGDVDMDDNSLPDLLIGSPGHDAAVLLRTPPLVHLEAVVRFEPPEVRLSDRRCQLGEPRTSVICADLLVAMTYQGKARHGPLSVDLELSIDPDMLRVSFYDKEKNVWRQKLRIKGHKITSKESNETLRVKVYGKPRQLDYKYPVEATVNATLTELPPPSSPPPPPPPLLDASFPTSFISHPSLILLCEDESSCHSQPNLVLHAEGPTHLVEGEEHLHLSVLISIFNDTAHGIHLNLTFPSDLSFLGSNSSTHQPRCVVKEEEEEEEEVEKQEEKGRKSGTSSNLTCVFDSYLPAGEQINLGLKFKVSRSSVSQSLRHNQSLAPTPTPLVFALAVSSDSADIDESDNSVRVLVNRVSRVNLFPGGASDPEEVEVRLDEHLKAKEMDEEEERRNTSVVRLGPLITHHFALINSGPTPLHGFQVDVRLPLKYLGAQLLYLVEPPVTLGPITCDSHQLDLNPYGFALPYGDNAKSYTSEQTSEDTAVEEEEEEEQEVKGEEEEMTKVENRTRKRRLQKRNVDLTMETSTSFDSSSFSSSGSSPSFSLPLMSGFSFTPPPFTSPSSSSSTSSSTTTTSIPPSTTTSLSSSDFSTVPSSSSSSLPSPSSPPPPDPPVNGTNKDTRRPKTIIIDSSKTPSEIIQCVGRTLQAGESAMIRVNVYLVAATVHALAASVQQQHGTTLIFDSTFAVHTKQRCVYVNNEARGAHGDDCYDPAHLETATPDPQNDTETTYNSENNTQTTHYPQNDPQINTQTTNQISETTTVAPRVVEGDGDEDNGEVGGEDGDDGDGDVVSFEVKVETHVTVLTKAKRKKATLKDLKGWKLLLTIIGGLMLLVVLSGILYKVGFFKRKKRLSSHQRREMRESKRRREGRSKRKKTTEEKKGGERGVAPERKFSNVMVMG